MSNQHRKLAEGRAGSPARVVLLHGLARSPASLSRLERALAGAGFATSNIGYPSTRHPIEVLAREFVLPRLRGLMDDALTSGRPLHFVTHSMGGIIVRQLRASAIEWPPGRVVMLGPPNAGSELVDHLRHWPLFRWINGPAGLQLGTEPGSLPNRLGPATFELGIIAGNRPLLEPFVHWIDGDSDGKVSVHRADLAGRQDLVVLPVSHALMMRDAGVIAQTLAFLETGRFRPGSGLAGPPTGPESPRLPDRPSRHR